MAESFLGEIKAVGFNFEPYGWLYCNGQTLQILENTALFSLLGTTYGGDGITNFKLPDLNNKMTLGTTSLFGENKQFQIPKLSIPSQSITFTLRNVTVIE
jgi:microcystin-dependent protein